MQVKVYAQKGWHAECIATFATEEFYLLALPALEKWAKEEGYTLNESIEDEDEKFDYCAQ